MKPCPKCGKPGGVELFMSIAPCDKCLGLSSTKPVERANGRILVIEKMSDQPPLEAGITVELKYIGVRGKLVCPPYGDKLDCAWTIGDPINGGGWAYHDEWPEHSSDGGSRKCDGKKLYFKFD